MSLSRQKQTKETREIQPVSTWCLKALIPNLLSQNRHAPVNAEKWVWLLEINYLLHNRCDRHFSHNWHKLIPMRLSAKVYDYHVLRNFLSDSSISLWYKRCKITIDWVVSCLISGFDFVRKIFIVSRKVDILTLYRLWNTRLRSLSYCSIVSAVYSVILRAAVLI